MSLRPNAPYRDELLEGGTVLIYEGHDAPRTQHVPDPKRIDQPEFTPSGAPTENAKFLRAASEAKMGARTPERVRVYEKLRQGIWSYNGIFHLVDGWQQSTGGRQVFRFRLQAVEGEEDLAEPAHRNAPRRRVIPTAVKLAVWRRDGGKCVACGATDDLHFDHVVPYSLGGTSAVIENVQLLCARHNLAKRNRIE